MTDDVATAYLGGTIARLRSLKTLGEGAIAQVDDAKLGVALDPESNSIAMIVNHLAGNMRSRWTDFLTTDGEKADRNRDAEFEPDTGITRPQLLARWEAGWSCVFAALESLRPEDLTRTVRIRGEALSVLEAITRQLAHYAYHVGQIVYLAKHFASTRWTSLSIPRKR